MAITAEQADILRQRLRVGEGRYSVSGSLPILFFGNLATARIATVALNPSDQEYLDRSGVELVGARRRFETLQSLGANSRVDLTSLQCDQAIRTMSQYFQPGKPIYRWFKPLDHVTTAFGATFEAGEVVHLDLVQEATDPTWSALKSKDRIEFERLRRQDLPFLKWQLDTFPFQAILCNGRTAFDEVCRLLNASVVKSDKLALVRWTIATANTSYGLTRICGWNLPLTRPTGLGAEGEKEMGRLLSS